MAAVAQLYARAFADVSAKSGLDLEASLQQLNSYGQAYAASHDLRELFSNPAVPLEQKLKVLDALAARLHLATQTRNFLAVLLQHERMAELESILTETRIALDQRNRVVEAEIVTASELTASQRRQFEQSVAGMSGYNKVRASYRLDKSLLGGATVKVGSTVFDGSLAGRLHRLKQQLSGQ